MQLALLGEKPVRGIGAIMNETVLRANKIPSETDAAVPGPNNVSEFNNNTVLNAYALNKNYMKLPSSGMIQL